MKEFFAQLRGAVVSTLIMTVICCGVYPLIVFGLGQAFFAGKANGSPIVDSKGTVIGSRLIGQNFSGDKYFQSRPSAAGNGYDSTSSGGSNLGPTSKKLADSITQNLTDYRTKNGLATTATVPADAVTASASGLDPHISLENAQLQAPRVARARGLKVKEVTALIQKYTDPADLGFLGDSGVNVLRINLALDKVNN